MLSKIKNINNELKLNEGIYTKDFQKYLPDLGFGLELEMQIPNDDEVVWDQIFRELNISSIVEFFKKLINTDIADLPINILATKLHMPVETLLEHLKLIKQILKESGNPYIGDYHDGVRNNSTAWRIEYDGSLSRKYGVEIITPNKNNKGYNYESCIKNVPRLCNALKELGFSGIKDKTGLHVHLSYKNKLNVNALTSFINANENKYSLFSLISYLTNKETDYYNNLGDYNRRINSFSNTFIHKVLTELTSKFDSTNTAFINFLSYFTYISKEIKAKIKDEKKKNLEYDISAYAFLDPEFTENIPMEILNNIAKNHYDYMKTGNHHIDYSYRTATIENRMLGGKKAFDLACTEQGLDKILKAAVTQLLPFLEEKPIDIADILRSTEVVLRETLIPILNKTVTNINRVVNNFLYHEEHLDDHETISKLKLLSTRDFDAVKCYTSFIKTKSNFNKLSPMLLNNIKYFKADKGIKKDQVLVLKGTVEINLPVKTSKSNRMKISNAVDTSKNKIDIKYLPKFKDINIGVSQDPELVRVDHLTRAERARIIQATVNSRAERAREQQNTTGTTTSNTSGNNTANTTSGRTSRAINVSVNNLTSNPPAASNSTADNIRQEIVADIAATSETPTNGTTSTSSSTSARTRSERTSPEYDPSRPVSGINSTQLDFDANRPNFNSNMVIKLARSANGRASYYYVKYIKNPIKKGLTVSFEYGDSTHITQKRYIIAFSSEQGSKAFYDKLIRAGIAPAPRGRASDMMYEPGYQTGPRRMRADAQQYADAAHSGPRIPNSENQDYRHRDAASEHNHRLGGQEVEIHDIHTGNITRHTV